jgi:1-acylglycerone phosphate reductase
MPLLDSQIAVAKEMFDVNVFALVAVTQAFAPLLIASKGTVVNIGSIVGKFPFPWQGFYNASKAAVNLLSDQLRIELSPFNVKVVNVVTGSVSTKFFDNLAKPPRLPEDSFYSSAKEDVEELMEGELASKNAMKVEVFAEGVANNAVGFGGEPISYFRLSHDFSPEIIRPLPKHHERAIANSPVTQLKSNPKRILWIGGEVVLIWIGTAFGWATIWVG